jgi:hypothetical protein
LADDPVVVEQQFVQELLPGLEVAEEDGPVVVEVRFKLRTVCEVHGNKNIRRMRVVTTSGR